MKHSCIKRPGFVAEIQTNCPRCIVDLVDELVRRGPNEVYRWFEQRQENPCDGTPPSDFNSWSMAAQVIGRAVEDAVQKDKREYAIAFALVACRIYEVILPQMNAEFVRSGFGDIGFNLSEVEAINIRVQIINRFGVLPGSPVASVEPIERWFLRLIELRYQEDLQKTHSFPAEIRNIYGLQIAQQVLQRLDPRYLTQGLREWILLGTE